MDPVPVIIFLVEQVISLVEYYDKDVGFKEQLSEMQTRLGFMMSYLADTDNLRTKKMLLKTTLMNLRDLMYEADDILTDCQLRDEYRHRLSSLSPKDVWFKHITMDKKLKDINSRMKILEDRLGTYLVAQQSNPESIIQRDSSLGMFSSQVLNSSEVVGLHNDLAKMKKWMFSKDIHIGSVHRIGIVGMGGLGKTTIAQKVFNDKDVVSYFNYRIWVSVSQAFNEENMLGCILKQLGGDGSGCNGSQMFTQIHQLLTNKTYLIVLDDVWDTNLLFWKKLCSDMPKMTTDHVVDGKRKCSCIIVTTRNEEVAIGVGVESARIHRPSTLDDEESWSLFCKHAFPKGIRDHECPEEFVNIGRSVTAKCGGLPLAIKTIGALLASRSHSYSKWKEIEDNFHDELGSNSGTSAIMASLQLSYAELPTNLKQFLLCFSIYPEDATIDAEQLIRWWVGENLIQGKKNESKTATEMGYDCLSELASRCLIEVEKRRGYDGRVYKCRMHDLVRELAMNVAEEEGFCSFDEKGRQKIFQTDPRWLGLTCQTDINFLKNAQEPKLRAFLLMPTCSPTPHFDEKITHLQLKSLRVLDLSNSNIKLSQDIDEKSFWDWIISLERLAYLNLSGLAGLKKLPGSIKKLRNLQLLVLRGCNDLSSVSNSIAYLKKLIILDLESHRLPSLPPGLCKLSHLQELSGFRIATLANKSCCRFSELKELTQLRVLRINICDESAVLEDELKVLMQLGKLKVLAINNVDEFSSSSSNNKVDLRDDHILNMLDRLCPPPNLLELYLKNYRRDSLWGWINPTQLSKLQYLCIEDGNLENLSNGSNGSTKSATSSSWKIEGLCLKLLPRLDVEWEMLRKDMPLLHYVEASRCYNLKGFPFKVNKPGVWNKIQVDD